MPLFAFSAQDQKGNVSSGTMEALNRETAMKILSEKDLIVTVLREARATSLFGIRKTRIRGEELLLFTQELASMLDAGISLQKAMNIMLSDVDSPAFKQVVSELSSGISEGTPLSELLTKYPNIFPRLYISMIEAAERSGELPKILLRLATYIENAEHLKKKVQGALYYPAVVLSATALITTFIFIYCIPKIKEIYDNMGTELPILTKLFINTTAFIGNNLYIMVPLFVVLVWIFVKFLNTEKGQIMVDTIKIKNKFLAPIFQKLAIARFSRTLSTLYSSGVPIIPSMKLVATSMGNRVMEKVVLGCVKKLEEGESIAAPLRGSDVFTNMAISMLSAGEEAGSIGSMLDKLADFYEKQVEIAIKSLTDLIEPLIMIAIGIIIGFVILVLALPFMQISLALK